jgi:hypothetical protein
MDSRIIDASELTTYERAPFPLMGRLQSYALSVSVAGAGPQIVP